MTEELRKWGSTVTAAEVARAMGALPDLVPETDRRVILPSGLYERAKAAGFDMSQYVLQQRS